MMRSKLSKNRNPPGQSIIESPEDEPQCKTFGRGAIKGREGGGEGGCVDVILREAAVSRRRFVL